jgi:hypothetical protein
MLEKVGMLHLRDIAAKWQPLKNIIFLQLIAGDVRAPDDR